MMLRSDSLLREHVTAELAADPACRDISIAVEVRSGIVTLSGTVPDPSLKHAAIRAVRRVFGVDGIDSRLDLAANPGAPVEVSV